VIHIIAFLPVHQTSGQSQAIEIHSAHCTVYDADIHPHSHLAPMKQVWMCRAVLERFFAACRQDAPLTIPYRGSVMYVNRRKAAWNHCRKREKPCEGDELH
jgi:hypothetical protein